jgi:hypothetical protein
LTTGFDPSPHTMTFGAVLLLVEAGVGVEPFAVVLDSGTADDDGAMVDGFSAVVVTSAFVVLAPVFADEPHEVTMSATTARVAMSFLISISGLLGLERFTRVT